MTNEKKKTTTKRRTVTPARLYKQVRSYVVHQGDINNDSSVEELLESLKEAALEEVIADM